MSTTTTTSVTETHSPDAPKFPHVHCPLVGTDGNAFAIMGNVADAMRRARVPATEISAYREDSMSGDYDHLLRVAMCTVDVTGNNSVESDLDVDEDDGFWCPCGAYLCDGAGGLCDDCEDED